MGIVKVSAGFGAVLAAALIVGLAIETTSLFEAVWPGVLLLGALVLLLTVVLAASLGEKVTLPTAVTAVIVGLLVGCLMGITFLLGAFFPFALELGGRDLSDWGGGDIDWDDSLAFALIFWGAVGAVVGAACGIAAWALRFALGRMRSGREGDTSEAAR